MSPIPLGILAAAGAGGAGAYDLLETTVLTSSASSVSFTSLNSTYGTDYKHLQIRGVGRSTRPSAADGIGVNFNADFGSNYSLHNIRGLGSSISVGGVANVSNIDLVTVSAANANADNFGGFVIDILDPFSSSKNTTVRALAGVTQDYNDIGHRTGAYFNTASIDEIRFFAGNGDIAAETRFSLYGVR